MQKYIYIYIHICAFMYIYTCICIKPYFVQIIAIFTLDLLPINVILLLFLFSFVFFFFLLPSVSWEMQADPCSRATRWGGRSGPEHCLPGIWRGQLHYWSQPSHRWRSSRHVPKIKGGKKGDIVDMLLAVNTELSNHVSILNLIIYFWKSELGEMLLWEKTKKNL